jgi:hypothetical protein
LLLIGILIFCKLGKLQNLGTLQQLSLGDLEDDGKRRREEKIMPNLMATSLRWRTHSARTNVDESVLEIYWSLTDRLTNGLILSYIELLLHLKIFITHCFHYQ